MGDNKFQPGEETFGEVSGHSIKGHLVEDEDTEGHSVKAHLVEDDDTEGHGIRGAAAVPEDDDTEGHAGHARF